PALCAVRRDACRRQHTSARENLNAISLGVREQQRSTLVSRLNGISPTERCSRLKQRIHEYRRVVDLDVVHRNLGKQDRDVFRFENVTVSLNSRCRVSHKAAVVNQSLGLQFAPRAGEEVDINTRSDERRVGEEWREWRL